MSFERWIAMHPELIEETRERQTELYLQYLEQVESATEDWTLG